MADLDVEACIRTLNDGNDFAACCKAAKIVTEPGVWGRDEARITAALVCAADAAMGQYVSQDEFSPEPEAAFLNDLGLSIHERPHVRAIPVLRVLLAVGNPDRGLGQVASRAATDLAHLGRPGFAALMEVIRNGSGNASWNAAVAFVVVVSELVRSGNVSLADAMANLSDEGAEAGAMSMPRLSAALAQVLNQDGEQQSPALPLRSGVAVVTKSVLASLDALQRARANVPARGVAVSGGSEANRTAAAAGAPVGGRPTHLPNEVEASLSALNDAADLAACSTAARTVTEQDVWARDETRITEALVHAAGTAVERIRSTYGANPDPAAKTFLSDLGLLLHSHPHARAIPLLALLMSAGNPDQGLGDVAAEAAADLARFGRAGLTALLAAVDGPADDMARNAAIALVTTVYGRPDAAGRPPAQVLAELSPAVGRAGEQTLKRLTTILAGMLAWGPARKPQAPSAKTAIVAMDAFRLLGADGVPALERVAAHTGEGGRAARNAAALLSEIRPSAPPGVTPPTVNEQLIIDGYMAWADLETAAMAGNAAAMYRLGLHDHDHDPLSSGAMGWYRKAADAGHAGAMTRIGMLYDRGERYGHDYTAARRWWRKAAAAGESDAMFEIGNHYYKGRGVQQSYSKALGHWRKAADAGDATAMRNIGVLYANGQGVQQDQVAAAQWYRAAADAGDVPAMTKLGVSLENGRGVPKDVNKAMRWYLQAARSGDLPAMLNIGLIYYSKDKCIRHDDTKAMHWWRKAADRGYAPAMTNVGYLYESGAGVRKSTSEAAKWYHLAADRGDGQAMFNLGKLYDDGLLNSAGKVAPEQEDEALVWYRSPFKVT
jgi:TPR repeat protein